MWNDSYVLDNIQILLFLHLITEPELNIYMLQV